jgi:hypothetical protein
MKKEDKEDCYEIMEEEICDIWRLYKSCI